MVRAARTEIQTLRLAAVVLEYVLLNHALIRGTSIVRGIRRSFARLPVVKVPTPDLLENLELFCPPSSKLPRRRALLSLVPSAWATALAETPNIKLFNISGLTFEVVKALNEKGYVVDLVDYRCPGLNRANTTIFILVMAGTRGAYRPIVPSAFVMQDASTSYWKEFNRMSQERYDNFCRRRGLPSVRTFVRSTAGTEEGEDYLARRADASFLAGPRTAATFNGVSRNMSLMYLGASVENDLLVPDRDFETGRTNFIYVAGTQGNVQKGLDLLIEAFARMPHLHLYIYCKLEEEVRCAYREELGLRNIHYVYHYAAKPLRFAIRRLLKRINFTITAPIDIGPGTAFLGSMGLGLIPVGYVDIQAADTNSVLADSYSIEALMDSAERASRKSAAWCRQASMETQDRFRRLHDPPSFGANFKALLDRLGL